MERAKIPHEDVEAVNRRANAPEDRRQNRAKAELDAATWPASGAAVHHARVGAELAGENASDGTETADAIKRAAENDGRV